MYGIIKKTICRHTRRAVLTLTLTLTATDGSHAEPRQAAEIFVLHSYSQEYPWTQGQHQGFIAALKEDPQRVYDVRVEYLDSKRRNYSPAYAQMIAAQIRGKYPNYWPSAIYVSDDNALSFALAHMDELFPDVPVFFSGVNDYAVRARLDPHRVTGVFEKKEIAPNLALMQSIAGDHRDITIVGDASQTYRTIEAEIRAQLPSHPNIRARFISCHRLENLISQLKAQKPRVVFLATLGQVAGDDDRILTLPETISAIVAAGDFIVFSMEDVYLQPGVLGGYVTSAPQQGRTAASLLRQHLDGAPLAALTAIETSPNAYLIDSMELARSRLSLPSHLLHQVTYVNLPDSFYQANRSLVLGSLYSLLSLLLLGLLSALLIYVRKNRQIIATTQQLAANEERLRALFELSPVGIALNDFASGDFLDANEALISATGYSREDLLKLSYWDIMPQADAKQQAQQRQSLQQTGRYGPCEKEYRHKDGNHSPMLLRSMLIRDASGKLLIWSMVEDISSRKQAEEELIRAKEATEAINTDLRESKTQLDLVLEATAMGIWNWQVQTGEVSFNERWAEIIGYRLQELQPLNIETWIRHTHPDDIAASTRLLEQHWRGDSERYVCEARMRHKQGHWVWVLDTGKVVEWQADGKPQRMIGTHMDVSERKQAEEALWRRERFLAQAQQIAHMGSWELDLKRNELRWSDEVYRIFEIDQQRFDASYESFMAAIHPEDKKLVDQAYANSVRDHTAYDIEHRLLMPDGRVKYVNERGETLYGDDGQALRSVGTVQDITQRRQAEEALQRTEEHYRNLFEDAPVMYALTFNDKGEPRIVDCNTRFARALGYERDEILGHSLGEFYSPLSRSALLNEGGYEHAMREPLVSVERQLINRDGHPLLTLLNTQPHYDDTGQSIGTRAIFLDISERKRMELELRASKERADSANRAKSEFLANMSHEIRTPMNGVIGMTNLLLDSPLDQRQYDQALTIKRSAESLLCIINDILDFSKIEAGRLDLEIIDFDLGILLADFATGMALRAKQKGLELNCPLNLSLPHWYRGDPVRLRQILINLVGNAIKFTEQGSVEVRYERQDAPQGSLLRFTVSDSGIGLDAKQQKRLFERFTQADSSTTRKYGGTGLGLSISKQLVELMGGEIGVESTLGVGTNFWFTVNLPTAEPGSAPRHSADLRDQRILVVDDNATNRQWLDELLTQWGVAHDLVDSGAAALESLRQAADADNPYGIALLDMQMPGMDGEQLGTLIHIDPRLIATRTVLLTSQGLRGEARKMHAVGFTGYLGKPIDQTELYTALLQVASAHGVEKRLITRYTAREMPQFNARVLVVEDNITNQAVAKGVLKKFGVRIDLADNGEQALSALERQSYDLVLMDCQMPILDGYQATQRIRDARSKVKNHAVPIIAMTAHAMQGDRERSLAAGMNDHLVKPVDLGKLRQALQQWLPASCRADAARQELAAEATTSESGVTPAQAASASVFDYPGLRSRLAEDDELVREVVEAFLGDMPEQIAQLQAAVQAGDIALATRQSHKIKGAAANVGGVALSAQALYLEQVSKAGDLSSLRQALAALTERFTELAAAMQKIVD
jgi:PAS domain S-box-containing protein